MLNTSTITSQRLIALVACLLFLNTLVAAFVAKHLDPTENTSDLLPRIIKTLVVGIPLACAGLGILPAYFIDREKPLGVRYTRGFLMVLAFIYGLFFCIMMIRVLIELL